MVLVLTSDCLFQLERETGNVIELEAQPEYQNLTTSPNGDFILSDCCNFENVTTSIKHKEPIESPIQLDMIEFKGWCNKKPEFTCDEFLNWDRHLTMTYDSETNRIEIKSAT